MEDIRPNSVALFDAQYTTNHISMFKVLLHFLAPSMQNNLAVYIKFMELQYTLQFIQSNPHKLSCSASTLRNEKKDFDFELICEELFPYCAPNEKQYFVQMRNMFQTMRNMQNMMEMMETLKEFFPEGMPGSDGQNGFNPEMFTAMSSMFGNDNMDFSTMAEIFSGGK